MNRYILIIVCLLNFSLGSRVIWSSTPIDKFINHNFNQMIFREPVYLIPYDLKIGFFNYGGSDYFRNVMNGNFNLDSNPIILDNQDINNDFISSPKVRNGYFIELDIMKYNLLEKIYHQNLSDFHIGFGLRYSNMLSNPKAPIYFDENDNRNDKSYRFRPLILDGFFNISSIVQYSPKFYLYGYYSFGLSYASIYESLSQERYINGSGFNESFSLGYKYIINQNSLPYNHVLGLELRFGRTYIDKVYDSEDVTPIIGMDINSAGLFATFGTLFGGQNTKADEAYSMMLNEDYIGAVIKFKQFLNIYNHEFRYDEAKRMLNFCYTQIPYQYFDKAVAFFNETKHNQALLNFNKAEQTADSDLILEIESYKRDIAKYMIEETDNNLHKVSFSQSINQLNKARKISPYLWAKSDRVEAKILILKGDILKNLNNYFYAIDYYQEALELDPSLFSEINNKYTELVISIIKDINNTNHPNELKLATEYLKMIIKMKPQYSDNLNKFITQIDQKLKNYEYSITKAGLKKYVEDKKKQKYNRLLDKDINLGMSMHTVEIIMGVPNTIVLENDYELWIYEFEESISTYFFKNYFLMKIDK